MSSSSRARAWGVVGVVRRGKVCSLAPMRSWLRQIVPSSASRSVRLCAGRSWGVVCEPALVLAAGERRAGVTGSSGCEWCLVGEQQRREAGVEFEGDVVGEHAEEHVGADARLEVVVDRADLDRVLDRAERAFGHLELLVGADGRARAESLGRAGGADDVEAVERGLGGDLVGLALVGEVAVGDLEFEVLGDLELVDDAPDALADLAGVGVAQAAARPGRPSPWPCSSSASVEANSSARLRARSAATAGLRQTTRRSPGKRGEAISARLTSSKSDSCRSPASISARKCLRTPTPATPRSGRGGSRSARARRGRACRACAAGSRGATRRSSRPGAGSRRSACSCGPRRSA